jgi:hypothetical protein
VIDPQTWPPLSGAVAGCGALLVLAGTAKLRDAVRDSGQDTAVQKVLRMSAAQWRVLLVFAGAVECAVGLSVCAHLDVAVSDTLMACLGVIFVALLVWIRRAHVSGDCGCLGRRASRDAAAGVTPQAMIRAGFVAAAGTVGAASRVAAPFTLRPGAQVLAWAVAFATFAVLAAADLDLRTRRCRRALLFPVRKTLAEVTGHGVYLAMAQSLGTSGDRVAFRRAGCVDEFWFPTADTGQEEPRYLAITAGRTSSGALAVKARAAQQPPLDQVRTLRIRRRPGRTPAAAADAHKSQPSVR